MPKSLIHQTGRTNCFFNFYAGNKEASETCEFRVKKMKPYGIRLSSDKFVYRQGHNAVSMTIKCETNDKKRRINVEQASIISIVPGCTLTTKEFIFKHTRELFSKSMTWQLISTTASDIFNLLEQKSLNVEF